MEYANKLLVEGTDDLHVCYHLMEHHKVPICFEVKDKKGVENLIKSLRVELRGSDLTRLGVIVDADISIAARWASLRGELIKFGYGSVPANPTPNGTIIESPGLPRVGIWVMPDNSSPGMLEHFIKFLVPDGDELWEQAEMCLEEIQGKRRFLKQHFIKAHLHTWLAWQKEPGRPIGTAIAQHYLDADVPEVARFVDWLHRLFVD